MLAYMRQDQDSAHTSPGTSRLSAVRGERMTWVTWRQYRYQGMVAAALFAAVAVVLILTGLHAAWVWHSALTQCTRNGTCGSLTGSGLSLGSPLAVTLVLATAAVPVLPGPLWGAPAVAHELETGTHQLAWTQGISRRRWPMVRTGWLLLAAAVLAGRSRPSSPGGRGRLTRCTQRPSRSTTSTSPASCPPPMRSSPWPSASAPDAAAPHPARTGSHPGRLRRRPGIHRHVAPRALHDTGHRVLQAHGTFHPGRVVPASQAGLRWPGRQACGA